MSSIQIILPLRNPPKELALSINSIVSQTDRNFRVLISDNHSTNGLDLIDSMIARLRKEGIEVQKIKPPRELGRVEHWNWAHHMADGDWVKPLFAGDWLDSEYISKLRKAMCENPASRYIYTGYMLHRSDEPETRVVKEWLGNYRTPEEMSKVVMKYGMLFGPPSAAAYEKALFIELGGYPTQLPICSDCLVFCSMSSRHPSHGIPEPLFHFNIHGSRFSTGLSTKRKSTFEECITYYFVLAYYLWSEGFRFSRIGFVKLLLRETRSYLTS